MLGLTREHVCRTWGEIFCPAQFSGSLCSFSSLLYFMRFFSLTGTQLISSRLEYTRSIDTRATDQHQELWYGKICQCKVQCIVFILVHKKTLQGSTAVGIKKIAKYSSGGSDFNKLPGNVLHLKDLVLMISMHKFCMFFFFVAGRKAWFFAYFRRTEAKRRPARSLCSPKIRKKITPVLQAIFCDIWSICSFWGGGGGKGRGGEVVSPYHRTSSFTTWLLHRWLSAVRDIPLTVKTKTQFSFSLTDTANKKSR